MSREDLDKATGVNDIERARFKRDPTFEAGRALEAAGLVFESDEHRNLYGQLAVDAVEDIIEFFAEEDDDTPPYIKSFLYQIAIGACFGLLIKASSTKDAAIAVLPVLSKSLANGHESVVEKLEQVLAELRASSVP